MFVSLLKSVAPLLKSIYIFNFKLSFKFSLYYDFPRGSNNP